MQAEVLHVLPASEAASSAAVTVAAQAAQARPQQASEPAVPQASQLSTPAMPHPSTHSQAQAATPVPAEQGEPQQAVGTAIAAETSRPAAAAATAAMHLATAAASLATAAADMAVTSTSMQDAASRTSAAKTAANDSEAQALDTRVHAADGVAEPVAAEASGSVRDDTGAGQNASGLQLTVRDFTGSAEAVPMAADPQGTVCLLLLSLSSCCALTSPYMSKVLLCCTSQMLRKSMNAVLLGTAAAISCPCMQFYMCRHICADIYVLTYDASTSGTILSMHSHIDLASTKCMPSMMLSFMQATAVLLQLVPQVSMRSAAQQLISSKPSSRVCCPSLVNQFLRP